MIKLRYSDLPTGLHVRTVVQGRHTILYLLPGLTAAERRAAIRRVRSNARVGYGPRLPASGMAAAVIADRVRTTIGNTVAAVRVHPGLFVPVAVAVASAVVVYLLLGSVTVGFWSPRGAGPGVRVGGTISGPGPAVEPAPSPVASPAAGVLCPNGGPPGGCLKGRPAPAAE